MNFNILKSFVGDVKTLSSDFAIDPVLIMAVVCQESRGRTNAIRFEPSCYKNNIVIAPNIIAAKLYITTETEKVLQCCSYGLMQIMGSAAREFGFTDVLTELLNPHEGLFWGVKYLSHCLNRYNGVIDDAISAYNSGHISKIDGKYHNQNYVDSVKNFMSQISALNLI